MGLKELHMRYIGLLSLVALSQSFSGCSKDDVYERGCMKVEYVGVSDSYCGGPHQIRVLEGADNLKKWTPGSKIVSGSIITAVVPENLREPGKIFYFDAAPAEPKICDTMVMAYLEVKMLNVSEAACP
jgi:hypothetical protein